jgi:DNA-directed RNA polymerase specialized sigma24 family protein
VIPGSNCDRSIVRMLQSLTRRACRMIPRVDLDDVVGSAVADALASLRPLHCRDVSIRELSAVAHAILARRIADYWRAHHRSARVELLGDGLAAVAGRPEKSSAPPSPGHRWCPSGLGRRQRTILEAIEAGRTCTDVAGLLNLPVKEVVRIVKNLASRARAEHPQIAGLSESVNGDSTSG